MEFLREYEEELWYADVKSAYDEYREDRYNYN